MSRRRDFSKYVGLASGQKDQQDVYEDLYRRGKDSNNRLYPKSPPVKQINPGKIKQLKLLKSGGSVDPLKGVAKVIQTVGSGKTGIKTVDKQKKKDAAITKNLKKMAKTSRVRAKPQKLDITPDSKSPFSIQKQTIMMAGGGEVINMTKSTMINPETGE